MPAASSRHSRLRSPTAHRSPGAPRRRWQASVIDRLDATGEPGPQTAALILERYPRTSHALPNAARLSVVAASLPAADARIAAALPSFAAGLTAIEQGHAPSGSDVAAVDRASPNDLGPLLKSAETLIPAQQSSTAEWQKWWGVCIAGQVVFILLVFTMRGRWNPRTARREREEHERRVEEELQRLQSEQSAVATEEKAA